MPRHSQSRSRSRSGSGSRSRSRSPARRERGSPPATYRSRNEKDGNKDSRGHWKKNERPSKCVGVFGLDWNTSERELERKMQKYGKIVKCVMVMNRAERRSKGFGFVTYERIDEAEEAVRDMNGRTIEGRTVRVDYSFTKDELDADEKRVESRGDEKSRYDGRRSDTGRTDRVREDRIRRRERSPEYVRRPKRSSRSPSPYNKR